MENSRYAAPSIGAFVGNSPLGSRQGCRELAKGQESLLPTPDKCEKHRKQAASGAPFLWILSFGEAKESISSVGTRTHIQSIVALATPFNYQTTKKLPIRVNIAPIQHNKLVPATQ